MVQDEWVRFFLFKTSGFLKIDPQKIILRRFEKYLRKFPILFFSQNDNFPLENQYKIDDMDPTSENFLIVPKASDRVMRLRAFGAPVLLASNFLMI